MDKTTQLLPRLSEKTYGLSNSRVYVVDVPRSVNKHTIKRAIEKQFDVVVSKVNVTNISGKTKRSISKKGRRVSSGSDVDIKKAYVTLAESHSLPFFAAIEEEEKQAEKIQDELAKKQEVKPKKRSVLSAKKAKETK